MDLALIRYLVSLFEIGHGVHSDLAAYVSVGPLV